MKITKLNNKTLTLIGMLALLTSFNSYAVETTGNIGVYSKYILRGIAAENDNTAVQGGVDIGFDNGFYLGWWASNLGYNYNKDNPDGDANVSPAPYTTNGFENDFYGGYTGSVGSWFGYTAGLIQYYYVNVDDSNLTELLLAADFKYVALQAQYLLTNGWWGNSGDIYWTLNGDYDLPRDFNLGFSLGYYTYDKDDAGNSKADFITTQSSAFRHLNITASHPVGNTGANVGLTYIIAGEDRSGVSYDNTMVLDLTYDFDI